MEPARADGTIGDVASMSELPSKAVAERTSAHGPKVPEPAVSSCTATSARKAVFYSITSSAAASSQIRGPHGPGAMAAWTLLERQAAGATAGERLRSAWLVSRQLNSRRVRVEPSQAHAGASAYVPYGKAEWADALPGLIRRRFTRRRKRSQEFTGIDCVAATIQPTSRKPTALDSPVDRGSRDAGGPCRGTWCVHRSAGASRSSPVGMFPCSR